MSKDRFPAHWRSTILGDLGEISGGGTPSTKEPEYWGGSIPWLVPSEVTKAKGLFIGETERSITELGLANCGARLLPKGSVLMTSRATIGEVVINKVPMATNQGFINIVCDNRIILNEFLAYWIIFNRKVLKERAYGVTFKEITKSNFKTIPIILPPLSEQRAIAKVCRAINGAIETRQRETETLEELFRAMLDELITGRRSTMPLVEAEGKA